MASHHRAMLFCVTLFVFAPALYTVGEWLAGSLAGGVLFGAACAASYLYMRSAPQAGVSEQPPAPILEVVPGDPPRSTPSSPSQPARRGRKAA